MSEPGNILYSPLIVLDLIMEKNETLNIIANEELHPAIYDMEVQCLIRATHYSRKALELMEIQN